MTRSPYIRDRIADLPQFRDRDCPLPMTPLALCSQATAQSLPKHDRKAELEARGLPPFLAALTPIGSIEVSYDESIPFGVFEIDGVRITLAEMTEAIGP